MTNALRPNHWNNHRTWSLMLPPGRPSQVHLDYFASHLRSLGDVLQRATDVCVLGSTPELRDLCFELSCASVTVIDRSPEFHRSVADLCIYSNPRERIVFADWSHSLAGMDNTFDAILSDLTLGNVPYSERSSFFAGISGALRTHGIYVDKVLTADKLQTLEDLDERYRYAPLNLITINDFANDYFFLSELISNGRLSIPRILPLLKDRFRNQPRLGRLLDEAVCLVTPHGEWHYGLPWSEVSQTYGFGLEMTNCTPESRPSVFAGQLHLHSFKKAI